MQMGIKRDQFIHDLDRLLNSNKPGSLAKALRLTALRDEAVGRVHWAATNMFGTNF
jgi:hypothetical protein